MEMIWEVMVQLMTAVMLKVVLDDRLLDLLSNRFGNKPVIWCRDQSLQRSHRSSKCIILVFVSPRAAANSFMTFTSSGL